MPRPQAWPQDEVAIMNRLNEIVEDLQMDLDAGKDSRIPVSFKNEVLDDPDNNEPNSGPDTPGPRPKN